MKSVAAFLILCTILLVLFQVQSHAEEEDSSSPASGPPQFSGPGTPLGKFPPPPHGKFPPPPHGKFPPPPPHGKFGLPPPPPNNDVSAEFSGPSHFSPLSQTLTFTEEKPEVEVEAKVEGDEENKTEDKVEEEEVKEDEE
ncbi:uncharacterized protein LOC142326018 isoform X1 [Lycorma delicatula]|uniref:uncharacterized protein LOC142326018 isoform X1 n=1 Tax=Lycorma delicatula TaxID=130591 RepID=UPI003F5182A7